VVLFVVVATATTGCGHSGSRGLAPDVVSSSAPGFNGRLSVNTSLSEGQAASATVMSATDLWPLLRSWKFSRGYLRVWTVPGGDYVSATAFQFASASAADALVSREFQEIDTVLRRLHLHSTVYALQGVDGAKAFIVPSQHAGQSSTVQCVGSWQVHATLAVQLLECTQAPRSPQEILDWSKSQQSLLAAAR
jgi:hypothetical protein